jgi:hypothetical protein
MLCMSYLIATYNVLWTMLISGVLTSLEIINGQALLIGMD